VIIDFSESKQEAITMTNQNGPVAFRLWDDLVVEGPKAGSVEIWRIIAKYDLPSSTVARRGKHFRYVFHCHILEDEQNERMGPCDVAG